MPGQQSAGKQGLGAARTDLQVLKDLGQECDNAPAALLPRTAWDQHRLLGLKGRNPTNSQRFSDPRVFQSVLGWVRAAVAAPSLEISKAALDPFLG